METSLFIYLLFIYLLIYLIIYCIAIIIVVVIIIVIIIVIYWSGRGGNFSCCTYASAIGADSLFCAHAQNSCILAGQLVQ